MNFKNPADVSGTIRAGDEVERVRGLNRARINSAANGMPPLTEAGCKQWGLNVNFNTNELAIQLQHARRQYSDAFLKSNNFFNVTLPLAPKDKRDDWGAFITTKLNKVLKDSLDYFELVRSKFSCVACHGVGAQMWEDPESPVPTYVAIEDLRLPTNTRCSFDNTDWFAVRKSYTPGELAIKALGPNASKGWNVPVVKAMLDNVFRNSYQTVTPNYWDTPEKMFELVKQNAGLYTSDQAPIIPLFHFYFKNDEDLSNVYWQLKIIPDYNSPSNVIGSDPSEFIYESKGPFAQNLSEILHVQFGDLNNKAPFLYHSVRGLGFLLMEPCYFSNLMLCREIQHAFENMNMWVQINDPSDRSRAQKMEFINKGIVPAGVKIVPQNERHQIDSTFVQAVRANLRQLQAEAAASYTQDIDNGTGKEMTATETMARVNMVNALMSGLINTAAHYERFSYMEICRRFCNKKSEDKIVRKFQNQCLKFGIPADQWDSEDWDIQVEVSLGGGNPTMAQAQSSALMELYPQLQPSAQQVVLHKRVLAITSDPNLARQVVPNDNKQINDGQEWAISIFGTLMQGVPIPINDRLPAVDQGEMLLGMLAGKISNCEQNGNVCTASELQGMSAVSGYIGQLQQIIAQNTMMQPVAKEMGDVLGKLQNVMKGFAQRLAEQQGQGDNGQQAELLKAQSKAEITQANAAQKMHHKEQSFLLSEQRKDATVTADQKRKDAITIAEIGRTEAKHAQELEHANHAPKNGAT
jgi:hypothetical protein